MTRSHFTTIHVSPAKGAQTRKRRGPRSPTSIHVIATHSSLLRGPAGAEPSQGFTTVYGSFTTTTSAADCLRASLKIKIPGHTKYPRTQWDNDTPPDSPLSSTYRSPSISRMSLPPDSDWSEPQMSSEIFTQPPSPSVENLNLHPVLEALEKKSRLSCRSQCSTCLKIGRDYPRCGRCAQMWCSRECRLQGGKKHICPSRTD
ncbi:hypothetical protein SCLCIDRAFT_1220035 [Scleroderma citrinum Foug A]|uniref:Uncharacterized protein n=1 Tax=Scleroderma citrinum Foug A TaxID=1036808 RepID=A0A0C3DKC2_9AGAM|nr:hypothetical protein SCLCIDRAFT_1220035 [Scleroderma citrinum Foug A]